MIKVDMTHTGYQYIFPGNYAITINEDNEKHPLLCIRDGENNLVGMFPMAYVLGVTVNQ